MLMPMLPPRLRTRLRIAVPWVRMCRGSVDGIELLFCSGSVDHGRGVIRRVSRGE
jgi:hypothetical protein